MTNVETVREIAAPHSFLFGLGVVLISRAREAEALERPQLMLRECWGQNAGPLGHEAPTDHPRRFDGPTPQHPPEDVVSLIFENPEGLENLIRELVTLHALRYPGLPLNLTAKTPLPLEEVLFGKYRDGEG